LNFLCVHGVGRDGYRFKGLADGGQPSDDRLAIDANGNIFGTTNTGGDFTTCPGGMGCGVVFEVKQWDRGR